MMKWMCLNCGWVYELELGDPASGISPGTRWEDIPEDWKYPDRGSLKAEFDMVEL